MDKVIMAGILRNTINPETHKQVSFREIADQLGLNNKQHAYKYWIKYKKRYLNKTVDKVNTPGL